MLKGSGAVFFKMLTYLNGLGFFMDRRLGLESDLTF